MKFQFEELSGERKLRYRMETRRRQSMSGFRFFMSVHYVGILLIETSIDEIDNHVLEMGLSRISALAGKHRMFIVVGTVRKWGFYSQAASNDHVTLRHIVNFPAK